MELILVSQEDQSRRREVAMRKKNALIIGSAGRDFHNFNTYFKDNDEYNVVGFTGSQQVPGISGRKYPAELAGGLYTRRRNCHGLSKT